MHDIGILLGSMGEQAQAEQAHRFAIAVAKKAIEMGLGTLPHDQMQGAVNDNEDGWLVEMVEGATKRSLLDPGIGGLRVLPLLDKLEPPSSAPDISHHEQVFESSIGAAYEEVRSDFKLAVLPWGEIVTVEETWMHYSEVPLGTYAGMFRQNTAMLRKRLEEMGDPKEVNMREACEAIGWLEAAQNALDDLAKMNQPTA